MVSIAAFQTLKSRHHVVDSWQMSANIDLISREADGPDKFLEHLSEGTVDLLWTNNCLAV